ncbi:MAG TPA: TIGR03118 family protein [Conexibacter sp.]|jgi:uncharacterized protein (TIGR03118 family)
MNLSLPDRRTRHWKSALAVATSAGVVVAASAIAHPSPADAHEAHHAQASHHVQPGHHSKPSHRPTRGHNASHGTTHHSPSKGHNDPRSRPGMPGNDGTLGTYAQRNLIADQAGAAETQDSNVINPWGLAFGPSTGPATQAWLANFGTNTSTLYRGGVNGSPVVRGRTFTVPGMPTGQVFNGGNGFNVTANGASGPAQFIFDTVTGTIDGWNTNVPSPRSTDAETVMTVPGASFTGLAISQKYDRLYAADFRNNKIDVFDGKWNQVNTPGQFIDPHLPAGYSPFGVEDVNGTIVVAYALLDPATGIDIPGAGHGVVDTFSESGRLEHRVTTGGTLNSPWGIAQAPKSFGAASGDLLIGNLGDGTINAFDPHNGRFQGQLADANGKPIAIEGLWALKFGNGNIGATNQLLFTAGPSQYAHGLFGELTATGKTTPHK